MRGHAVKSNLYAAAGKQKYCFAAKIGGLLPFPLQ